MIDSQKRTEYYTRSKKIELSGSINGLSPITNGVKPRNGEVTHASSFSEDRELLDKSWSVMDYQEYIKYSTRSRLHESDVAERLNGKSISEEDASSPGYIFKFYRKFGYYWNVFPKTDYSYLPGSKEYKKEVAPGIPVVPNLSRPPLPTRTTRLSKSGESSYNCELSYEESSRSSAAYQRSHEPIQSSATYRRSREPIQSSATYRRSREPIQSSYSPTGDRHSTSEARRRSGQNVQSSVQANLGRSPLRLETTEDRQNHINHLYWSYVERGTVVRRLRRLLVRTVRSATEGLHLPPHRRLPAILLLLVLILPLLYYLLSGSDGDGGSRWWAGSTTAASTAFSSLLYLSSLVTEALLYIPSLCLQLLGLLAAHTSTTNSDSEMKMTSSRPTLPLVLQPSGSEVSPPGGLQLSQEDLNELEARIVERIRKNPGLQASTRTLQEQEEFFQKMKEEAQKMNQGLQRVENQITGNDLQKINLKLDWLEKDFSQKMVTLKEEVIKLNERLHGYAEKQLTEDDLKEINQKLDSLEMDRRNWYDGLEEKWGVQLNDVRVMAEGLLSQSQELAANSKLHSLPTERMVERVVARYHADRTGKPDYALQTAGGSVVRVRCTQTYTRATGKFVMFGLPLWDVYNGPDTIIKPGVMPGECWAFEGSFARVTIQLASRVRVTGFTVEHSPRELALHGHIASAPKDFSVWALEKEDDENPLLLGEFTFQDGDSLQEFKAIDYDKGVELIDLRVVSNHGHPDYTCLYRFRVHGVPVD